MTATTIPPSQTLYVKNLDSKIKKHELRRQLYALFTVYGRVMDIVATRTSGMRGQAFVVFETIQTATSALRGLTGFSFYGQPLEISYAKTKSRAVLKRELGTDAVQQMQLDGALPLAAQTSGAVTVSQSRKRTGRSSPHSSGDEQDAATSSASDDEPGPQAKRPKTEKTSPAPEFTTLRCTYPPDEISKDMLIDLFKQYDGVVAFSMSEPSALINFKSRQKAQEAKDSVAGLRPNAGSAYNLQLSFT